MIGWAIRLLLVAAGAVAAVFVARDAENFTVVQGMVAVGMVAALVLALALFRRK